MRRTNFCGTFAAGEKGKSHRKSINHLLPLYKKKAWTCITTNPHVASQPSHVTDLSCLGFRFLVPAVPLAGWLDQ
jgi:hypothetical protein